MRALPLVERLKAMHPGAHWSASGFRIRGLCPYHNETTPSFDIHLDRGYAKCFGCDKYIWNPISLWGKLKGCGFTEALTDLKQMFGLKFLTAQLAQQVRAWERNQLLKKKIAALCHDELINAVANPFHIDHASSRTAVDWLLKTRQLPSAALPTLGMVGILPPVGRILDALDAEALLENARLETEAAYEGKKPDKFVSLAEDARKYLHDAAGWVGAVMFRYDLAPDAIGRIKFRRPASRDFIYLADGFEESLGFFSLGWNMYQPLYGAQQYMPGIYVVEGEFDALSIMSRQMVSGGPKFVVTAAGGNSNAQHIDDLAALGFNDVYLVGDHPNNKGDELNRSWMRLVKKLHAKIFIGYDKLPGSPQDPDEAILAAGLPAFSQLLLDTKNPEVWANPPEWVFQKATPEVNQVEPENLRRRTELAAEWGNCLKNGLDCEQFVMLCAEHLKIPPAQLKREIVAKGEDEPAFILRLVDVLSSIFFVIGQKAREKDRILYLWHKHDRKTVQVALADDGSIEREFGSALGPSFNFFFEKVGIPPFLEVSEVRKQEGVYLQDLDKRCRWYYRQALTIMSQQAPDFEMSPHKGQGLHVIKNHKGGPPTLYLVNGRDVYVGSYESGELAWKKLEGPTHNGVIFDVGTNHVEPAWLPAIEDVADLDRAKGITVKDLWKRVHRCLDIGWKFKNHAVTVDFLAAQIVSATVTNAFRRQVMLAFHADTQAGKSRLVMGLLGGGQYPRIHILPQAVGMSSFTAAGIRQVMDNKTRPLCLDEFEDEGDHDKKSRTINEVLEMFRNNVGEVNTFTMGSRGGDPRVYTLSFPVYLAAINKARKVQDANRIVAIDMDREPGRPDPQIVLLNEFGEEGMQQLRADMGIGMLPHIWDVIQAFEEIEKVYSKKKPTNVDVRFFETLFPAMAIMKLVGLDYADFVDRFLDANKEALATSAKHTDSTQLFEWICHSPTLTVRTGDNRERNNATLLQMLSVPESRDQINYSAAGVYFDAPASLVIVNWTEAIQGVLKHHARWCRETNTHNLRHLANRAPNVLKPLQLKASGALERLRGTGIGSVSIENLTAYDVRNIIEGAYQFDAPTPPTELIAENTADDPGLSDPSAA